MSDLYRRCEKCDGERLISNIDTGLIDRCDCREGFLPDDTLQQIAEAWKGVARGDGWMRDDWGLNWPKLAALLDGLVEGNEE